MGLKDGAIRWLADLIRVAVGTGLRRAELCAMRWSWVDLSGRLLRVRNGHGFRTKNGHERVIPLRGEALDVIQRLHDARRSEADGYVFTGRRERKGDLEQLNGRYVSRRFKKYVRLARLPDNISFHSLRHTFVSWLVQEGVRLDVVRRVAGHADIQTTMGYAHLAPDDMAAAMERVFGTSNF